MEMGRKFSFSKESGILRDAAFFIYNLYKHFLAAGR